MTVCCKEAFLCGDGSQSPSCFLFRWTRRKKSQGDSRRLIPRPEDRRKGKDPEHQTKSSITASLCLNMGLTCSKGMHPIEREMAIKQEKNEDLGDLSATSDGEDW